MTKADRQIRRIEKMEASLDALIAANEAMSAALDAFEKAPVRAAEINGYLGSENWWQDFEADADGRLPAGLKRGVLSEDGVYNALIDYRELVVRMLKTVTASVRNG